MDTNALEEEERIEMCIKAHKMCEEKIEDKPFQYLENEYTSVMKSCALDLHSNSKPRRIQAFRCPSNPSTYLLVQERKNNELVVYIILRMSDVKSLIRRADNICYETKFVVEITPGKYGSTYFFFFF